jgi:hypothetical protein
VRLSDEATAALARLSETIVVDAAFFGFPAPAARDQGGDVGEIHLGRDRREMSQPGTAVFATSEYDATKLTLLQNHDLKLLINVYSGRKSSRDNLLSCDIYEDSVARAAQTPIQIRCNLIGETGRELVGLRNVALEPGELVWGFDIQLREGRILAVCRVPQGWKITSENYGEAALYKDGGGAAQGSADFGHDALSATDLSEFGGLLLVDRSAVHQTSPSFSGLVTTSGPSGNRKVQLRPQDFWRRGADRCPAPPARGQRQ